MPENENDPPVWEVVTHAEKAGRASVGYEEVAGGSNHAVQYATAVKEFAIGVATRPRGDGVDRQRHSDNRVAPPQLPL